MPNVTNQLQLAILSTEDSTNQVLVNRTGIATLDETSQQFASYALAPVGGTPLPFPAGTSKITKLYVKNLAAAGSLQVTAQPNGGASVTVGILGPGDIFCYWQNSTGAPAIGVNSQGYTAVNVASSVANLPFEFFMGG